jgi:hypothetical protein
MNGFFGSVFFGKVPPKRGCGRLLRIVKEANGVLEEARPFFEKNFWEVPF